MDLIINLLQQYYMKRIFLTMAACLPFALFTSCETAEPEVNNGVATECTYFLASDVTETITLADKRSKDIKLNVKAVETVGVAANLTFTLSPDASLVSAYNQANSAECVELPSACYSFDKKEVTIGRFGVNSTTATLKVTATDLEEGKVYLLPVKIANVTGGDYKLKENAECYISVQLAASQDGGNTEVDITAGLYDDPCVPSNNATPDLVIKTADDMKKLQTLLEDDKMKYVVLEADIDMSGITDWQPLNTAAPYTKGIEFNGKGHTIKNFSCKAGSYRSMFGILHGRCYDVKFENATIDGTADGGSQPCGVIAGYAGNKSGNTTAVIHDVEVTGSVVGKAGGCGGLVGVAVNLVMKRCSFNGTIENNGRRMGGLVGYHNAQLDGAYIRIEDSWTAGSITGVQNIGGIIGQTQYDNGKNGFNVRASVIRHCYSTMTVTANQNAGGIAGGCSYGGSYATTELDITKDMVIGNIAWNDAVVAKVTTTGNYSSAAVVGYVNIYQYLVDNYRKADFTLSCPVDELGADGKTVVKEDAFNITTLDQDNSSPALSLFTGTVADENCPYAYKYAYPYHGKAASSSATVSSIAKTLKWDENVWDLSGALPVLK